jgi:hypothetical protein
VRATERDETQAVGEYFVLDNGCVLVDEDVFDGKRGDLGEEDSAKGIRDRGVDACERKGCVVGGVVVELDIEVLRQRSAHQSNLTVSRKFPLEDKSAHTSLKYSRSHSWFSPGQCPGKSVDAWLPTISVPTCSFCVLS